MQKGGSAVPQGKKTQWRAKRARLEDHAQCLLGDHRTPSRSNSIALSARSSGFLRNCETVIADRVVEATILFCDLVGFTTLSQTLPADRVIGGLPR
jgi:class 3 adenylate cyclase